MIQSIGSLRGFGVGIALAALLLMFSVRAQGEPPKKEVSYEDPKNPAFAPVKEDPSLPRVLLIGDSISIGYTPEVRKLLAGKANVLRIPTNGGPTSRGIQMIDEWLGTGHWDVIHFNWGLHDVKRMKEGKLDVGGEWQVDKKAYRANLETLVRRLERTGAKLIWASTTPIPEGAGGRIRGDEVKANAIALKIMRRHGVKVDDLYAAVLPVLDTYQQPRNVHFSPKGYAFLAQHAAASIFDALKEKKLGPSPSASVREPVSPTAVSDVKAVRFKSNPIIRPEMLPGQDGKDINGPSLIRVPDWLPKPLGKYYLYFADHSGKYIRLAYADALAGPWQVYEPGTLRLEQAPDGKGHIASPDVHVDAERKEIRMYFHCPSKTTGKQTTYLARSEDGLHFTAAGQRLGPFYFRAFRHGDYWYALAKRGWLYRSKDGIAPFEEGPNPFLGINAHIGDDNGPGVRHVAADVSGNRLRVFYTNIGDMPESVLCASIDLTPDWTHWKAAPPELVLKPETPYEGADIPLAESKSGRAKDRENALRDPGIFKEDGHTYLLYSVAGESGIAIAELVPAH